MKPRGRAQKSVETPAWMTGKPTEERANVSEVWKESGEEKVDEEDEEEETVEEDEGTMSETWDGCWWEEVDFLASESMAWLGVL